MKTIKEIYLLMDEDGVLVGFALDKQEAVNRGFLEDCPFDGEPYYERLLRL